MYGENGELEYGGSLKNKDKYGQPIEDWDELYHKGTSTKDLIKEGLKLDYYQMMKLNTINKILFCSKSERIS